MEIVHLSETSEYLTTTWYINPNENHSLMNNRYRRLKAYKSSVANSEAMSNLMHKYLYSYNITILYMFRALLCSSSGVSIVYVQHLVPPLSVSGRTLSWLRELFLNQRNLRPLTESGGTRCCTYTIEPPEDEYNNARNMQMIVILYE